MYIPQYLYSDNDELQRYLALLTQILQGGVSNNGFTIAPQSTANITAITGFGFLPVMPAGTMWFNTTLMKMQFISVAAIPSTSTNAVIETITSA